MKKLKAVLVTLPRWFATPGIVCMVLLGGVLSGGINWLVWVAALSGLCAMSWGHGMNTFLDYAWTGFDKGTVEYRSKGKTYTVGQNVIASGTLSVAESFWYSFIWLVLSAVFALIIHLQVGPWIWLPWVLGALVTFLYSWGKLHYLCEFALGMGFGPLAVMLGASATPHPQMLIAFLAGLPFFVLWGYFAETIDQWTDAEPNWPRGLRNMGALLWKNNVSFVAFVSFLILTTFAVQLLITPSVLKPLAGISLVTFIPFSFCLLHIEKNLKVGVIWGLVGIFLYALLLLLGQILG